VSRPTNPPDMFPALVPPIAVRYWKAIDRYFSIPGNIDPPTVKQVVDQMIALDADKPASPSTIDRACRRFPQFCPKPKDIHRWMRPPWEPQPHKVMQQAAEIPRRVLLDCTDEATGLHTQVEAEADQTGLLRLVSRLPVLLVAGVGTLAVLDTMDGKVDGAIHWCLAFIKAVHQSL